MNLTIRQLRAFREVMRLGSISAAARAVNRAQPSVSTMISNLEQELGFGLFERDKSRMIPTPEARYFLEEVEVVLDRLDKSERVMRQIGDMHQGTLKIACLPVASHFLLPSEIVKFTKDKPEVSVSLMTRSSPMVEELIASQQFDIGLAETPPERGTLNIRSFEFERVCAINIDDPLSKLKVIKPSDLHKRPMAALSLEHAVTQKIKDAFEQNGSVMFHKFEVQTGLPILELVENNACCAIVDAISAASYQIYRSEKPRVVFKPFKPAITSSISVLTPAQRPESLLAKAFYAQLVDTLSSL